MKQLLAILTLLTFSMTAFAEQSLISENFEASMAKAVWEQLSKAKKLDDLLDAKHFKAKIDQNYLKSLSENWKGKALPKVSYDGKKTIVFEENKEKVEVEFVSVLEKKFKINGYVADFRPYKLLSQKQSYLERILQARGKKASALKILFIGEDAHAGLPLLAYPLLAIIGGTYTYAGVSLYSMRNQNEAGTLDYALAQSFILLESDMRDEQEITDVECAASQIIVRTNDAKYSEYKFEKTEKDEAGKTRETQISICACNKKCKPRLISGINDNKKRAYDSNWQPKGSK